MHQYLFESASGHLRSAESAPLSSQTSATLDLTGLLIKFTTTTFLLNTATFNQLLKTTNRVLNRFFLTQSKFNHFNSPIQTTLKEFAAFSQRRSTRDAPTEKPCA